MNTPTKDERRTGRTCALLPVVAALALLGCQHTVKVEAPEKPIVINLNVKIEQEVRIKVEEDAEKLLETRDDIF